MHTQKKNRCAYALVTAAYNEEETIRGAIESVIGQTIKPVRWVVVSDGSFDLTDDIVRSYASRHEFMRFVRIERAPGRSFGSKVAAIRIGSRLLEDVNFDFLGNLDADVSVDPTYFSELMAQFDNSPRLGVAGGFVCEDFGRGFESRMSNRTYSVAHAAQLVTRECYEAIGGYAILEYGGEDWHAQTSAKMKGWDAVALPDLKIYHHRHTGAADNLIRHKFRQGRMDYSLGSGFLFETLKCLHRFRESPLIVGGTARLFGFLWACAHRDKRPVSNDFVEFLRREQAQKIVSLFRFGSSGESVEFDDN
jgi:poly-beta-1,6-N-acetyl-D-glucosamine synthase